MKRLVTFAVLAAVAGLPLGALAQQQSAPSPPTQQQPMAPQAPSTGSPGGQAVGQSGPTIASDSLMGAKVRDQQGKEIGHVSKLLIDPSDGKVSSVIIKRGGGILGMGGGEEMAVPWSAVRVQRGQDEQLVVTMQQEPLERAPQAERERGSQPGGDQPAASPGTTDQRRNQDRK